METELVRGIEIKVLNTCILYITDISIVVVTDSHSVYVI